MLEPPQPGQVLDLTMAKLLGLEPKKAPVGRHAPPKKAKIIVLPEEEESNDDDNDEEEKDDDNGDDRSI